MAKFLLSNGISHEQLAVTTTHFQMARLAEERRIDIDRLLAEHELAEDRAMRLKQQARRPSGSPSARRASPAAASSSLPHQRGSKTAEPTRTLSTNSPGSIRPAQHDPSCQESPGSMAFEEVRPMTYDQGSQTEVEWHGDGETDVSAIVSSLSRTDLEMLVRQKVRDGTPLRSADLRRALENGSTGQQEGVGTLSLNGVQYEVRAVGSR